MEFKFAFVRALAFVAATSLCGCVAVGILVVRYQPASGSYETDKPTDIVASEAGKLRAEIEADELAEFSRARYDYRIVVHEGSGDFRTRLELRVEHLGEWDGSDSVPPGEKLGLFVRNLAIRIGGDLVPVSGFPEPSRAFAGPIQ